MVIRHHKKFPTHIIQNFSSAVKREFTQKTAVTVDKLYILEYDTQKYIKCREKAMKERVTGRYRHKRARRGESGRGGNRRTWLRSCPAKRKNRQAGTGERPLKRGSVLALHEAAAARPGRSKVVPRPVQVALSMTLRAFYIFRKNRKNNFKPSFHSGRRKRRDKPHGKENLLYHHTHLLPL